MVQLKRPASFASLLAHVPSYFLRLLADQKGYRFSKSVHQNIMPLMPAQGVFDKIGSSFVLEVM